MNKLQSLLAGSYLFFMLPCYSTYAQVAVSDSLDLVAFYHATNGPNWTTSWDLTQPVSSWNGIGTDGNRVSSINLANNNLDGTITFNCSTLNQLTMLDISENHFSFGELEPLMNHSGFNNTLGILHEPQILDDIPITTSSSVAYWGQEVLLQIPRDGALTDYLWVQDNNIISNDNLPDTLHRFTPDLPSGEYTFWVEISHPFFPAELPPTSDTLILEASDDDWPGKTYESRKLIVQFEQNTSQNFRDSLRTEFNASLSKICDCHTFLELWEFAPDDTTSINTNKDRISSTSSCVDGTGYNYYLNTDCAPHLDTVFSFPDAMCDTNSIKIAMIDSGIKDTLGLGDYVWCGDSPVWGSPNCTVNAYDFIYDNNPAADTNHFHATHMASYLLSSLPSDVDVRFLNYKTFNKNGRGEMFDAICAIYSAIENQADIINASWNYKGKACTPLENAIDSAGQVGILTIVAAGNDGEELDTSLPKTYYPAAYTKNNMLTIGTFEGTQRADFSNYSSTVVDYAAPGWQVEPWLGATPQNGTSYSAAYVSALAAGYLSRGNSSGDFSSYLQSANQLTLGWVAGGKLDTLSVNITVTHNTNPNQPNGSIVIDPIVANQVYDYSWEHNSTIAGHSIEELAAGNYIVTITDQLGYALTKKIEIKDNPIFTSCPANIHVYADTNDTAGAMVCGKSLTIAHPPLSTGVVATITNNFNSNTAINNMLFPVGITTINWTAVDNAGLLDTCIQKVTVVNDGFCSSLDPCGCTDPDAHNFDLDATMDNGTCETCNDGILNGDEVVVDCGGSCLPCNTGCTNSLSHNYDPTALLDDGSCTNCYDDIMNGDETGTDCGGTNCAPCCEYIVIFQAENYILLEAGFEVQQGCEFNAIIGPCGGSSGN